MYEKKDSASKSVLLCRGNLLVRILVWGCRSTYQVTDTHGETRGGEHDGDGHEPAGSKRIGDRLPGIELGEERIVLGLEGGSESE